MLKRIIFFLLLCTTLAVAQSDLGTPSGESFWKMNDYESVNLATNNLLFHAPIRAKNGPISFNGTVSENVTIYIPSGSNVFTTTAAASGLATGYWHGDISRTSLGSYCGGTKHLINGITDRHGTFHPVNTAYWDTMGCLPDVDVYTSDNSGYEVYIPKGTGGPGMNPTIYDRNGIASNVQAGGTITDLHGNQITVVYDSVQGTTTYTDDLSATPILTTTASGYVYTDSTGTLRTVTTSAPRQNYLPAFTCPNLVNVTGTFSPLASVSYPDGSLVQLTYEKTAANNLNGRLKTVVLPTGGTYTHNYLGGTNNEGLWCESGGAQYWVSNATMTISNGTGTWTFARTVNAYPSTVTTNTVTKPDGSKIDYTFISNILTSKVVKDTNGTTELDRMTYCYDSTISNCNPSIPSNHPAVVRAYHYVPGIAAPAETDTAYDTYGNITSESHFDFGPTLVETDFFLRGNYNTTTGVCDPTPAHANGRICWQGKEDAVGNILDGHWLNYSATGDLQTAIHGYAINLTDHYSYNPNGTLASHTAPNGVQTTFAYTGTGGCNTLLPTSETNSIGTVSITWDCNGGVPKTTTSLNGVTTTLTYGDPRYRVTQKSDNGGQAAVTYSYISPTQTRKYMTFNGGTSIADSTLALNPLGQLIASQHRRSVSGNYETTSFLYNPTGQLSSISTPCLVATIGTACPTQAKTISYDGAGREKIVTSLTSTPGVITYTYSNNDVLATLTPAPAGENPKSVQYEYNGLGQLGSICAVTSTLTGRGSCGQRTAATGYLTKFTLNAVGQTTRISRNAQTGATPVNSDFLYDGVSRIIQQTLPETGTSNFYYDTAHSPCNSPLAGLLNKTQDAAGNVICNSYDPVGRLSGVTFPSGPNAANSHTRQFFYDSNTTGFGPTIPYGKGRLVYTQTCDAACTTYYTGSFYNYDKYGRITDYYQNSSGLGAITNIANYFHTTATYSDNGALLSLSGIPGVSNFTYGLDSAGRPYSATSGSTPIVNSVTYDASGNPILVPFANGDQDDYTYDAASQNMTQYRSKVGTAGTLDTGTLTWNPNGTLQKLVVVDNLSNLDDATCATAHDDVSRISGYNCGALWNEGYIFDPAGNVTKSGNLNFAPGYTPANNRMLAPYTYDANGMMLFDGTLGISYGWDSSGSMVSAGTATIINDAFGKMVQKTVGSTKTYVVYSPVGKLGTASSLTAKVSIRIPLPGGSSITYDSAGNERINHTDFRGSTVLTTNRVARTLGEVFCYGPMGEVYCGTASTSQFEGGFQDTTTGLNDFDVARYSGAQGRSVSPSGGSNGYVKTNSPF